MLVGSQGSRAESSPVDWEGAARPRPLRQSHSMAPTVPAVWLCSP